MRGLPLGVLGRIKGSLHVAVSLSAAIKLKLGVNDGLVWSSTKVKIIVSVTLMIGST